MKRLLRTLIVMAVCLTLVAVPLDSGYVYADYRIPASGTCGADLTWSLDETGELIISGTGAMDNWSNDGGSAIGRAPWYEMPVYKVTIMDGVTSIGDHAFSACFDLASVTIPQSVTSIGVFAFEECSSLESVTIPEGVNTLYKYAFAGCRGLRSITIPESVDSIGEYAFVDCSSLAEVCIADLSSYLSIVNAGNWFSVPTWSGADLYINGTPANVITIPNGMTEIKKYAFYGCKNITDVTIPDTVKTIEVSAFEGCISLTSVNIPEGTTRLGERAFYGCSSLSSVTIPSSLPLVEDYVFSECTGLENVTINRGLLSFDFFAFSGCTSLKKVIIPDSVMTLEPFAFGNCPSLTSILLPESLSLIRDDAFDGSENIENIYVVKDTYADSWVSGSSYSQKIKYVTRSGDHYYYEEKVSDPTCDKNGLKTLTCVVCGDVIQEDIPALPHTYVDTVTPATLTSDGKIKRHCSVCGHNETTVIYKPAKFTLSYTTYTYTGAARKPAVTITDSNGKKIASSNYTVTYTKNTNIGTATAKITFKSTGNYSGTKSLTYKIRGNLANTVTKVSVAKVADKTYTGSSIKPTVTVKAIGTTGSVVTLKRGTDYILSYATNKNVGYGTVTITGKGNYSGTKRVTFKINPKGTTLKTLTATSKGLKATWTKQATKMSTSYITGYQIQYSTSSTFSSGTTTVNAVKYSTVSKTISKLKAKKKYYVRIRTYKIVNSEYYVSPWSAKKYVTTKA